MNLIEAQVDRIVGPTHHFGGLGVGNLASMEHAGQISNPQAAALQGLEKMRTVATLGAPQLILPPQPRPDLEFLRALGFGGTDTDVLRRAYNEAPQLLSAAASCSAMWTANAATVTPGVDSGDQVTRLTVANLHASIHRAIESEQTWNDLQALSKLWRIHRPVPGGAAMRDEGAANHMRLGSPRNEPGLNIFVFGDGDPRPITHWPRQSRSAYEAIARRHELSPEDVFFIKQHPAAIDAGAFHNDVVAMSHQHVLIHHEFAFSENESTFQRLGLRFQQLTGAKLVHVVVSEKDLSLADAVRTYLFNSQIVSRPNAPEQPPVIICAAQVESHSGARSLVQSWCEAGIFDEVHFVNLDQSMLGGGGPACLRLRVPLPEEVVNSMDATVMWSPSLDAELRELIRKHYVSELRLEDLARIEFYRDACRAHDHIAASLHKKTRESDR